jgi:hypothetical protein
MQRIVGVGLTSAQSRLVSLTRTHTMFAMILETRKPFMLTTTQLMVMSLVDVWVVFFMFRWIGLFGDRPTLLSQDFYLNVSAP